MKKFEYKSVMQIPKLDKIVVNIACGEAKENSKVLDSVVSDLMQITGQRPVMCRAKKSIANFKLREGMVIGAKVTLRGDRMYEFLDRFFNLALPRVRDFRGINPNSFDGRGNYSLGIKEQLIFPEIEYDKIDKVRGMDVRSAADRTPIFANTEYAASASESWLMPVRYPASRRPAGKRAIAKGGSTVCKLLIPSPICSQESAMRIPQSMIR